MKKTILTSVLLIAMFFSPLLRRGAGGEANAQPVTFNYTGTAATYTVPACVYSISVDVKGAEGAFSTLPNYTSLGGKGGRVQAIIPVTPGEVLTIRVGEKATGIAGGWNGGGSATTNAGNAGGGGGASDIRQGGTALSNRVIVAGGGGGAGYYAGTYVVGGHGGGLTGGGGYYPGAYGGGGGTQTAGGAAGTGNGGNGIPGTLGIGGNGTSADAGGGGGGYYGGGGGGVYTVHGAGGGGSGYAVSTATGVMHTLGYQFGNGEIIITPIAGTATPGAITGPTLVCPNSSASYSILAVPNAASYTWIAPPGAVITSGQGTTSISVSFGSTSGNISVTASGSCGTSAASIKTTTFSPVANPKAGIAAGSAHSLSVCADRTVLACGWNNGGQLGDGSNVDKYTPMQVGSPLSDIMAVAAGDQHSLFLKNNGTVWACGYNAEGQLGDGTTVSKSTPVQVSSLSGITGVAAGRYHSLFLKNDGTVWACGYNAYGQLGDGTNVNKSTPVQVNALSGITAVATSYEHSLFLKNDGTVWACGRNSGGQLGDGTSGSSGNKSTPVQVSSLSGITALAAGFDHSLFLKNDGTVWACGNNSGGKLGDGTTVNKSTPVQVSSLSGITGLAANQYSLFLKNDGTVWACGNDNYGQFGNGTTSGNFGTSTPVQAGGSLSGITALAAGVGYSLFLKNDGTVWACGKNLNGQLGYGSNVDKNIPVQMMNTCAVDSPPLMPGSITGSSTVCANSTGTYSISAVPNATYSWTVPPGAVINSGQCGTSISVTFGSTSGNISVTASNTAGPSPASTQAITVNANTISTSVSVTHASCNASDGSASANVSGGNVPYTYSWSNGQTTTTATGLAAGSYTITVTDASGCTQTADAANVSNIGAPAVTVTSSTNVSCNGGSDGTAAVAVSGGAAPYTYLWCNGQSAGTATGLPAGCVLTVTDAGGCAAVISVPVTEPNALTTALALTNSCNGASNGEVTVSVSGGTPSYFYSWSTGQTTSTATGLSSGNYTVTITDGNNCATTGTISIIVPAALTVTTSTTDANCGSSNGTSHATAGGGTSYCTYSWSNGQSTATATGLAAGSYTITVTDGNGCTQTGVANVSDSGAPDVTVTSSTNVSCNGGSDGTAAVAVSGGVTPYTYLWCNGQSAATATGLSAGSCTLTVTDLIGCVAVISVPITEPAALTTSLTVTNSCNGASNGEATVNVTGGTAPYTYSWNPSGQTTQTATGLSAGNYTATITDANGCSIVAEATVTVNPPFAASAGNDQTICIGQSATLTATGGTNYLWDTGDTDASIMVTPAATTTYTVFVTDASGCSGTDEVTVTVNPNVMANAGADVSICAGSDTTLNGTGNGTYLWSPSSNLSCTTCPNPIANPTSTATYTLTVTNVCGTASDDILITVDPCITGIARTSGGLNLSVSPNPTKGFFNIYIANNPVDNNLTIEIMNIYGQIIYSEKRTVSPSPRGFGALAQQGQVKEKIEIDITGAAGMYFLKLTSESGTFMRKIIKQ